MTDRTEVTLDRIIEHHQAVINRFADKAGPADHETLRYLLELQRIRAAERPEPVARSVGNTLHWYQGHGITNADLYGPEVLAYADRMRAERDSVSRLSRTQNGLIEDWRHRAERAESALNKLKADTAQVVKCAYAVVKRWETPVWKDAPPTAEGIYALRDALAAMNAKEDA